MTTQVSSQLYCEIAYYSYVFSASQDTSSLPWCNWCVSGPILSHYCNQFLSVLWIGYLGGALLSRILTTDLFAHKFDITVLVRSTEKAHRLESEHNVKACIGSLEDIDTVEQLAQQSHVVWSMVREHVLYQLILLQR